ncbi:MAG TPA: hypothetical protein VGG18_11105 [Granulicella sp.]
MLRPRRASSVAQSHINPLSVANMIPKSLPMRFPLAAANGSWMLGLFLESLSRATHSASNTTVAADPAGMDQTGCAGQRASATMHHAEPASVTMPAPATLPRICARVDLEKGGSMKEISLRGGLIVGV